MKESWKDINGYEGLYQVSNYGRIKNLSTELILKPTKNSKGYLRVELKNKRYFIHRLVAKAFIPNIDNKPFVNHIDCNITNNCVSNLEWCTHKENMRHMVVLGRNKRDDNWKKEIRKSFEKYMKKIVGINLKNGKVIIFDSIAEARRSGFQSSCICNCCQKKRKKHKGYMWFYLDEWENTYEKHNSR